MKRKVCAARRVVVAALVCCAWATAGRAAEKPAADAPLLLVHYSFDEQKGDTAADASGNGHDGKFAAAPGWEHDGAPLAGNRGAVAIGKGKALTLAATDKIDGLKSFTLAVWVKGTPGAVLVESGAAMPLRWMLQRNCMLHVNRVQTPPCVLPKGTKLDGWHHWAVTYDSTSPLFSVRFYLDGEVVLTTRPNTYWDPGAVKLAGAPMVIGTAFANAIDDFRLYGSQADGSGALTPMQVAALAGKPITPEKCLQDKLSLVLGDGEFKEEQVVTVLAFIRGRSRVLDPAREGIRIEIEQPQMEEKPISIELKGKTIGAALTEVCRLAGLTLTLAPPDTVKLTAAKGGVEK